VYSDSTITRDRINTILSLGAKASSEPDFALDMRDSSIYWINDLENDDEYEDWPDDLTQLFFRMGGVMLRPVRRNVFNLLITVDPEDVESTSALLKMAQSFMAHKSPVRIGIVFSSSKKVDEESDELSNTVLIRRIMNYALSEGRTRKAFNDIVETLSTGEFNNLKKKYAMIGEEFDFGAELARDFIKKSGRPTPGAFLNGVPLKWDSVDDFEEVVLNQLLREAQSVQIDAYNGKVRDDTDIFEYLMNKPNVLARLNDKILDVSHSKYVSFGTETWEPGKVLKNQYANLASQLDYLTPSSKRKTPITVTIWVFADIGSQEGQKFLRNAVDFLSESSTHARIAFIPTDTGTSAFKEMVTSAFAENDINKLKKSLEEYSDDRTAEERNSASELSDISATFMRLAGVPVGGKGLVVNGRIIGPLDEDDTFEVGDWALVEKFSYDSCAKYFDSDDRDSDAIMRICSALGNPNAKSKHTKRFTMPDFSNPVAVDTKVDPDDVFYVDLVAVVDPASRSGHKMAAIMSAMKLAVGQWTKIQIIFNTQSKNSELPLKSYFRFVAGQHSQEDVVFENLPREPLFTQNMIAPDNWMVEVKRGLQDLDNIRLRDLGSSSIDSEYELEYILVEGHCLELKSGTPPRGLQFTLTPENEAQSPSETIVMANLGYFQLKAGPGVWSLGLREGPSRDIFSLENYNNKPVVVHSFQSVVIKVKVKRNPGKETVSLLDTEEEAGGSWFGFGGKKPEQEEQVINVFSVASGHLYERLLRIMMLSVMKNTQSKVKFWFLKNYLSPTIKDLLPELAKKYGFEYELVQYHWPRWLNPQREKQRIIWGYKILFLDVLFPLSLKKIVFVDADQIVRTDMKELFELDLEGNPYGYTPFCDSRTEMEGFRFWKQGYWRSHLGKRKYHISALYVVDLVRFRRVAAGDRLRGQYQALSQDPNSLSNLDQDLPNNMIYQVGIKSLPQEWLWCETWCDEASKKYAKTIDLCNNPQTKEPKLEAAQRIVPEWKDYDRELREFIQKIQNKTPDSGSHTTPIRANDNDKSHEHEHQEL